MKLKIYLLIIPLVLGFLGRGIAQNENFQLNRNYDKLEIPFTYVNNLLLVKVKYNESLSLWFILDTGAENTILIYKEIATAMGVKFHRKFTILGADLSTELVAFLTLNNSLELGDLKINNQPILVLDDDYFSFKERIGLDIHGIIGADILKRFVVQINYRKKVLILHNPEKFDLPNPKFKSFPLDIIKNKPYITAHIDIQKDTFSTTKKLLLDTGSASSLLLQTNSHQSLALPNQVIKTPIGYGLGGELVGYNGRIHQLKIGDYNLGSVTAIFQKLPDAMHEKILFREGLLGNEVLSHFHIIIDYIHEKIFLAPNKNFNDEFVYDKSGLTLISGHKASTFLVTYVVPNSPAAEAGIQKNDLIKSINRIPINFFELGDVTAILKKKTGKKIRLKVKRDGKKHFFTFRLRELI